MPSIKAYVDAQAGGGGWETESTDAVKLEAGRTRIWDDPLEGSIVLDSSITLLAGAGFGVEVELGGTGQVFDVNTGDGIVVPILAADPTGTDGQIYYNSATDKFRGYVNGAWENITAAAGAHNTTHQNGGADEISIAGLDGTPVELTNHLSDATDAHDASAISVTPAGGISSTDVQAALVELDGDITAGGIPATIFDAQGDIIVASAADTAARLAAGASGTILKSAGVATPVWAVAPNRHGCLVYFGGATQVVNNTFIPFNSEVYDSDAYHDNVTNNHRITIPTGLGGVYLLEFGFYAASAAAGEVGRIELNGTTNISPNFGQTEDDFITGQCVYPLVAADYVWVAFYGNRTLGHASAYERQPHFSATLLGA